MSTCTVDEVRQFLKEWVKHYEEGEDAFYDDFEKDASIFTISSPTRIDGVEEFRRGFECQPVRRRSQILSPEIKTLGNTAFVSYHNRVSVDGKVTNMRSSLGLVKGDDGTIRIVHLHNSLLGHPLLPETAAARSLEEVTLLEERVATAAAAVGTPK